jgi:hypothetical protein
MWVINETVWPLDGFVSFLTFTFLVFSFTSISTVKLI